MKLSKITFILSILSILLLIFLSKITIPIQTGTIDSIQFNENTIKIQLEKNPTELILFETNFIPLKKGDSIKFQGRYDVYKNKTQIIVDKIFKD